MSSISSSVGSTSSRISNQTRDAILASTQRSTLTALGLFKRSGTSTGDSPNAFRSFIQQATAGFVQAKSASNAADGSIARGFIENVSKFRDSLEISDQAKEASSSSTVSVRGSELKVGDKQTDDGDLALSTIARELVRAGGSVRRDVSTDSAYTFQSGALRGALKKDDTGVTGEVQVGSDTIRFRVEGTVIREFAVSDERVYNSAEYKQVEALLGGRLAETQAQTQQAPASTTASSQSAPASTVSSGESEGASQSSGSSGSSSGSGSASANTNTSSVPPGGASSVSDGDEVDEPDAPEEEDEVDEANQVQSRVTSFNASASTVKQLQVFESSVLEAGGTFEQTDDGVYVARLNGDRIRLQSDGDNIRLAINLNGSSETVTGPINSNTQTVTLRSASAGAIERASNLLSGTFGITTDKAFATGAITEGQVAFQDTLQSRLVSAGGTVTSSEGGNLRVSFGNRQFAFSNDGSKVTGRYTESGVDVRFTLDGDQLVFSQGSRGKQADVANFLKDTIGVNIASATASNNSGSLLGGVVGGLLSILG